MQPQLTIISGVPPILRIGAGRFLAHLEEDSEVRDGTVEIVLCSDKSSVAEAYFGRRYAWCGVLLLRHLWRRVMQILRSRTLAGRRHVILYHFQELGNAWCCRLLARRKEPTWIYALDCSFFCIRSYNHLAGEFSSCLRCCGGDYEAGRRHKCVPRPVRDPAAAEFLKLLDREVKAKRVRFLAQCESQASLLRRHYGPEAIVRVAGIWTIDMMTDLDRAVEADRKAVDYDVVFHGDSDEAKGFAWALEVARHCQTLRFLFPCRAPESTMVPPNCVFEPMRWETGLREAVRLAPLTLVPSLWSAPVEGALIKSLLASPRVAVARVDGAFSGDLPNEIVAFLSTNPVEAARVLQRRVVEPPTDSSAIERWMVGFRNNRTVLDKIKKLVCGEP